MELKIKTIEPKEINKGDLVKCNDINFNYSYGKFFIVVKTINDKYALFDMNLGETSVEYDTIDQLIASYGLVLISKSKDLTISNY